MIVMNRVDKIKEWGISRCVIALFAVMAFSASELPTYAARESYSTRKSENACYQMIYDKYLKEERREVVRTAGKFALSGGLIGAGVAVHVFVPGVGSLGSIPLTIAGSGFLNKGFQNLRFLLRRSSTLGTGRYRLLRKASLYSKLAPSPDELDEEGERPRYMLTQVARQRISGSFADGLSSRKVLKYTRDVDEFARDINEKYVDVLRRQSELNVPYITADDVADYFREGLKKGTVCSPRFLNAFRGGTDYFLASEILAKKLNSSSFEDMQNVAPVSETSFGSEKKKGNAFSRVFRFVKRSLSRKSRKKASSDPSLSSLLSTSGKAAAATAATAAAAVPTAGGSGSPALDVQGLACIEQLQKEHAKDVRKSLAKGSAYLAAAGLTGVVGGTCLGAFAPSPFDALNPLMFIAGDFLAVKGTSKISLFLEHIMGKLPLLNKLPFKTDEREIVYLAIASYYEKDAFFTKAGNDSIEGQRKNVDYVKYEQILEKLSAEINEKLDFHGCNVRLAQKKPSSPDFYPALWKQGERVIYSPALKGRTFTIRDFGRDFDFQPSEFRRNRLKSLSTEQCRAIKSREGLDPFEIERMLANAVTPQDIKGFFRASVANGSLCRDGFSVGVRKGGLPYLATLIYLSKKVQQERDGQLPVNPVLANQASAH